MGTQSISGLMGSPNGFQVMAIERLCYLLQGLHSDRLFSNHFGSSLGREVVSPKPTVSPNLEPIAPSAAHSRDMASDTSGDAEAFSRSSACAEPIEARGVVNVVLATPSRPTSRGTPYALLTIPSTHLPTIIEPELPAALHERLQQ